MKEILLSNQIVIISCFLLFCIFASKAFKIFMGHFTSKENFKLIKKFVDIHGILSFHMEAAYETIHKDNILVYSLDGLKPNEKDVDKLSHEFVKLTMRLSGPNMLETFTQLYGDEDTFFFVMIDYFNRRFEDDEIRSAAIEDIQNGED